MRKFIFSFLAFISPFFILAIVAICLPTTSKRQHSYAYTWAIKDSLLYSTPSPKLVLLGGSNFGFGMDSQRIKDSLNIFPVNMGLQASAGLKFLLDATIDGVNEGDILIISPEYEHFNLDHAYGSSTLIDLALNVRKMQFSDEIAKKASNLSTLNYKQWLQILKYLYPYALAKFSPDDYKDTIEESTTCYNPESFNLYGDNICHWSDTIAREFPLEAKNKSDMNVDMIKYLATYCHKAEEKGATVYVAYPSMYDKGFEASEEFIEAVIAEMKEQHILLIGSPYENQFTKDYMYDTNYHLNKKGVDRRTSIFIKDLKEISVFEKKQD